MKNQIGHYSFVIGVIIAIVLGIAASALGEVGSWLISLLIIFGMIVGFLNISATEAKEFLLVASALVLIAYAGINQTNSFANVALIGTYLKGTFDSILAFVVPAGVIVALKKVWLMARG